MTKFVLVDFVIKIYKNQGLKEKLTKKEEESSCLRNLIQKLIEQIKKMKNEKPENQDIISEVKKSDNKEELLHLRVHNWSLLTQIKKLKSDKKSLHNKLDQLINKESLVDKETMTEPMELGKSSDVNITIMDKGVNTESINLTTKKGCKSNWCK